MSKVKVLFHLCGFILALLVLTSSMIARADSSDDSGSKGHFGSAEILPVKYFASLPDVSQVELSPDGGHIASLVRVDLEDLQGSSVSLVNTETGKSKNLLFTRNEKYRMRSIRWGNNSTILVNIAFPANRYGTPTVETRLLVLDIKTGETRNAIPKRYTNRFFDVPQLQTDIIDMLPEDDEHFLLSIRAGPKVDESVYKVSLKKNKMSKVRSAKRNVVAWETDRQNNVRLGLYFKDTTYKYIHRFPGEKKWKTLWEFESFAQDQVWPIGFDEDPKYLYVNALHKGRDAIFRVDLTDANLAKELVYFDDNYDVGSSLVYSHLSKKVVGFTTSNDGSYVFWDKGYQALYKGINKGLPDTDNSLISMSRDERTYLVLASNDTDPGTYYLGNRDRKTLYSIGRRYERLKPELMVDKDYIQYSARDGLEIGAYLTLPKGRKKGEKLPTIIFPHGGPISYDGRGFDYWTQFFASRGYAVLQMNFRGSSGYGYDFMKAGLQSWGLAMQDDVEDGTRWMIENGYSDADKICIVGASYGGYAALMGVVKSPELYQCAVSFAGVTDIAYLVKSSRAYINHKVVKAQIGDDYKELKKRSPLHNAKKISVPTLLIHGDKDRSVRVQHSRKMFKALKRAKQNVTYLELENGSHYLSNNENRVSTFEAMNAFLIEHLSN